MEFLMVIYCIIGYWAAEDVLFEDEIVIHAVDGLFFAKLFFGAVFGIVLIPIAIIKRIVKR